MPHVYKIQDEKYLNMYYNQNCLMLNIPFFGWILTIYTLKNMREHKLMITEYIKPNRVILYDICENKS